ncbi:unnamed protein product [Gadus morhua 'NCC']
MKGRLGMKTNPNMENKRWRFHHRITSAERPRQRLMLLLHIQSTTQNRPPPARDSSPYSSRPEGRSSSTKDT